MKTLTIVLFFITSFFVRALRWLGVMQQKEYRFDRVLLFLKSSEGVKELVRLLPTKADFSKTGLKRPKLTKRAVLLTLFFGFLSALYFKLSLEVGLEFLLRWYPYPLWYKFALVIFLLSVYLVAIPFFIMMSVIPTVVVAHLQTYKRLFQARKIITEKKPTVIGITGSYGKTSTKILLAHILEQKYSVFMTPKSYNTKYSVAQSIVSGYTGEEIALIEYAAYKKGEIRELARWVKPKIALITGLTQQHVGLFGSLQEIVAAKAELVASLPERAAVICNVYDEQTQQIYTAGCTTNKAKLIPVGPNYAEVEFTDARVSSSGKLQFNWGLETVHTQLIGLQYLEIVHLAVVTAMHFKMTKQEIILALESFVPNEKFVMMFTLRSGVRVIDDGDTSNPKGFFAMIRLAKALKAQKKILVTPGIVDLGTESHRIHLELARSAQKVFNKVIFVGNSGQKEFQEIFGGDFLTTSEQLAEVLSTLDEQDLILIEGRMPAWAQKYLE